MVDKGNQEFYVELKSYSKQFFFFKIWTWCCYMRDVTPVGEKERNSNAQLHTNILLEFMIYRYLGNLGLVVL